MRNFVLYAVWLNRKIANTSMETSTVDGVGGVREKSAVSFLLELVIGTESMTIIFCSNGENLPLSANGLGA